MKVHSFIKDTIAMEQNEAASIAAQNVAYEHSNRVEASPASSTEEETASRQDTEATEEETGATEEKKGKKGPRNKKNI